MKEIPLTQGKVALVDDQDYQALAQHKWHALNIDLAWYAVRNAPVVAGQSGGTIYMHREIMGAVPGQMIDHWDGNGLNNQRDNLRHCTNQQNISNKRRRVGGQSSRYKGVWWNKQCLKWEASIKVNYERIYLGLFSNEADAARAYNAAALQHFGEFACLNEIAG